MCKGLAVRLSPGHLANLGSECHLQGTEREGRSHRPWGVVTRKGTQSELIFSVSQGLIREDREVEGAVMRLEAGNPKRRLLAVWLVRPE